MSTAPAVKGSQQQTSVPEKTMGTGTTYGGSGKLMDIDAIHAKTKCYSVVSLGTSNETVPNNPKQRRRHYDASNITGYHVAMREKTDSKIEEVKDGAKQ